MVNDAIRRAINASGLLAPLPFFKYDHLQEKIAYYYPGNLVGDLYFSINLYPYVGEAFNTNWYYIKPPLITTDVYSIVSESDSRLMNNVTVGAYQYVMNWQEYKAMSSWASINRILFVSNKLPIKREFYPVSNGRGMLNEVDTSSYSDLVSMNIICSFLFASTEAGDYRTNIVYSSSNIDNGDLIDMNSTGAIREIDVKVFWSDKNGNVFPIRLSANKQVNLRFVFVRRW